MDRQKAERLTHCVSILKAIEERPNLSRREIGEKTGISLMTIGKLCALFEEAELIETHKEEKSEVGRRACRNVLTPALSFCILDCSGSVYTLTLYDACGKTTLTLMHAGSQNTPPGDSFAQFIDRMTDMLSRIRFQMPAAVALLHYGRYNEDSGLLHTAPGAAPFEVRERISHLFPGVPQQVLSPAAAAGAFLELHSTPERIAVLLGGSVELAFTDAGSPFSPETATPLPLRVEDTTFGERMAALGAPDRAALTALFSAVSAFFPGAGIRVFLLPRKESSLTRGEINEVLQPILPGRFTFSEDPATQLAEGARLLLLCGILKKHI